MTVPYSFASRTTAIPLSELDSNFNTPITLGNTAIQLGNTVTTLNNMTLANVTISSGNVTITNVSVTTANVTTLNVATSIVTSSETLSYGTANGVAYLNGSKVLTTGNALQFDGTNLGIGIFPTTSLDVAGPIRSRVIGGIGQLYLNNGTTQLSIDNNGGQMVFTTAGAAEQMRLTSTGLGIGTSSPSYKLDVAGTIYTNTNYFAANDANVAWGTGATRLSGNSTNNTMVFLTNNAEVMRIDSSGNVGIGTSSPATKLDVNGGARFATSNWVQFGTNNTFYADSSYGLVIKAPATSNFIAFRSSDDTERMRIDSGGNLLVGTTSSLGPNGGISVVTQSSDNGMLYIRNPYNGLNSDQFQIFTTGQAASSNFYLARFYTGGTAVQFAVRGDGVVYAQNTTIQSLSDIRTKENIKEATEGINVINALRPVRFDFKEGFGNNRKNQLGFIAQEVERVFPDAVDIVGESDDPENPYKSVGPGALIPVLVKAIQELKAELDATKAEVAALKAN